MSLASISPASSDSFSSSTINRPTKPLLSIFSSPPISCSLKPFGLPPSHSTHKIVQRVTPIRSLIEPDANIINGTSPVDDRWSLRGKTALVTGGTRGIGHESELKQCLRDWKSLKFGVSGSVCDVSVRAQREELMETVSATFDGKLNILVNNVGRNIRKPTVDFTDEEFSFLMKTNVESVFHLSQLAHPLLKASGVGSIVFMSSVSSFVSLKSMSVQGATKGAINQLTKYLACEWAKDNIRTNAVAPWYIKTSMVEQVLTAEQQSICRRGIFSNSTSTTGRTE